MPIAETLSLVVQLLLVPVLVAGVGLAAYRMGTFLTFHPRQFTGGPKPFGWQGWLARSQAQQQTHLVHALSSQIKPLSQVFEYLAPQKWVVHAVQVLRPQLDSLIDEAIEKNNSVFWENLPITLKNRFYERAHRQIPAVIDDIIEEVGDQSDALIELGNLFAIAGTHTPLLSTRMLEHASKPYLTAAGGRFFVCMALSLIPVFFAYRFWLQWWVLAAGIYGSFCLALWVRHKTVWSSKSVAQEKAKEQRKREFAASVAPLIADELLTPRHWITAVIDGPKSRQTYMIVKKHVSRLVENMSIRTFAQLTIGVTGYVELKAALTSTALSALRTPFEDVRFNQSRSGKVTRLIEQRLLSATEKEIKALVAPAVQAQRVLSLLVGLPLAALIAVALDIWLPLL